MSARVSAWRRFTGWLGTLVALLLPYALRERFTRLIGYLSNPAREAVSVAAPGGARFWNRLLSAIVFFGGLPVASLFVRLIARGRFGPPPGSPSYWVRRPPPDELADRTEDPF
jgi:hypothetical protein